MTLATVKTHVSHILTKLDLDNRTQLALLATTQASPNLVGLLRIRSQRRQTAASSRRACL